MGCLVQKVNSDHLSWSTRSHKTQEEEDLMWGKYNDQLTKARSNPPSPIILVWGRIKTKRKNKAKIWKQPEWLSKDKWIKKIGYIHTLEYHSA